MNYIDFDSEFAYLMNSNNLKTVYVLGHTNPDGDACGSVLGLAHYIKANYSCKVIPYLSDTLDQSIKSLVFEDQDFDPFTLPDVSDEPYAVIVCDTATRDRIIGREIFDNASASLVIDHHASNEGYGNINNTVISESCAENIYHTLDDEYLIIAAGEVHPNAADYLYLGILHDTGIFQRANPEILSAASNLLRMGADHKYVLTTLFNQTLKDKQKEGLLYTMVQTALNGQVAYVIINKEQKEKYGIAYWDIHPISGELRDCVGIKLGFTLYEMEPNVWKGSFRSDSSWIDVNKLLNPLGGGGHAAASGLKTETDNVDLLVKVLLNRIEEMLK